MTTHELKTWPTYFNAVASGEKTFEVRRNDRDFEVGDRLVLREWDPFSYRGMSADDDGDWRYTGRSISTEVTYLLQGGSFGLDPDFCALGIRLTGPVVDAGREGAK